MAELTLTVDVDAPVGVTWAAAIDWGRQGEWMLGTAVRPGASGGVGVGAGMEAITGAGRLGLLDTMTITVWEPPYRCEVMHTGRVIRGTGAFEVQARGEGARFVWSEWLELPLGLGQVGWLAARPLFAAGVQASLRRFARWAPGHPVS